MKKNYKKALTLLTILFSFSSLPCNSVRVKEALLLSDLNNPEINDSHTRRSSKWIPDAEVYTFQDETTFENLFPSHPFTGDGSEFDNRSFYVGQIASSLGNNGIGTGTLLDIVAGYSDDTIRVIGITAMHNFVGITDAGVHVSPKFSKKFFMGAKSLPDGSGITSYGTVDIDKVLVQKTPSKDICLFEGTVTPNRALLNSNDELVKIFSLTKPTIVEHEFNAGSKQGTMYHYPLGKKNQRINTGEVSYNERHTIRSLFGSSGSSIFDDKLEIIGIHDGVKMAALQDKVVEVSGGDLPVAEYNSFVKVSKDDYDSILREGVNLYDGSITKKFIDDLSVFVESNSKE
ncbi:MAG: hypothetical protein K2W92_07560 [Alphaproteobacteria bacterium]|nr:hypothetical protein [Alphaproteobacteria bacterium]